MKWRVLGCHGGESSTHRLTSFLIDDHICLDTGGLCRSLSLDEQAQIDHVIISHTHLDHIRDLAFLADNVITMRNSSVTLHCSIKTQEVLRAHFFNNLVWPDFTKITLPGTTTPVLRYEIFTPQQSFKVGNYEVETHLMNHPVESVAMVFNYKNQHDSSCCTVAYSSDTGFTSGFWSNLAKNTTLKAIFCECSFPAELQWLADVSGHLSPSTLLKSISQFKLPDAIPILLYHFKPSHVEILHQQIEELKDRRLRMLQLDEVFYF